MIDCELVVDVSHSPKNRLSGCFDRVKRFNRIFDLRHICFRRGFPPAPLHAFLFAMSSRMSKNIRNSRDQKVPTEMFGTNANLPFSDYLARAQSYSDSCVCGGCGLRLW